MLRPSFLAALLLTPGINGIPEGSGKTAVDVDGRRFELYTYRAKGDARGPILLVAHGLYRNAEEYRDLARELAERRRAMVVVPHFDFDRFPYEKFTRGGLVRDGRVTPREEWTWSLVPRILEEVRRLDGARGRSIEMIGHSAGAQFLARMSAFVETGARRLVIANPGSYLAPDRDQPFPYGFGGLPDDLSDDAAIRRYLGRPLTILLGTEDTRRDDNLDISEEADRQGKTRLERGRNIFRQARLLAMSRGYRFGWRLVEVAGIGHDAQKMFDSPACAEAFSDGPEPPRTIESSVGAKLVRIPAGEFDMGMPDSREQLEKVFPRFKGERIADLTDMKPHHVKITRPFYMGIHEVTIGQFRQFVKEDGYEVESVRDGTGGYGVDLKTKEWATDRDPKYSWENPGFPQGEDHPVVNVTLGDAEAFCAWLSKKEGKTYRLPTEAEWEYACRAGTKTRYFFGDDPAKLPEYANVYDASSAKEFPEWKDWAVKGNDGHRFTAPVGQFKPNAFGLYDMHGNVWEWCSDLYGEDYYEKSPVEDPKGPERGGKYARRGGGWHVWPLYCTSWYRNYNTPQSRYLNLGFRLVMEPDSDEKPSK